VLLKLDTRDSVPLPRNHKSNALTENPITISEQRTTLMSEESRGYSGAGTRFHDQGMAEAGEPGSSLSIWACRSMRSKCGFLVQLARNR
jgi:hypothetical protein